MTRNVGTLDRILRTGVGAFLLWLAFLSGSLGGWVQIVAAVAGVVMLTVATLRICPIYSMLGIRTCPTP